LSTCYNPAPVEPHPRNFTRDEAEALLPTVDRLLGEAQQLIEQLDEAQAQQGKMPSGGHETPDADRRRLTQELQGVFEQIQALGIVVRDPRSGLIDFPSLREGRVVYLCWRRGEPLELRWWHEVADGFPGRQLLDD
jgi:hypothetical protein